MTDEPRKKKKWDDIRILPDAGTIPPVAEEQTSVVVSTPEYYTAQPWDGGARTVYKCGTCGTFRDDSDSMIEHLLLHHPVADQELMLERLLAYKPKEV